MENLPNFLSDPISTVIGAMLIIVFGILGAVTILAFAAIVHRRLTVKSIGYTIQALEPILNARAAQEGRLAMLYDQSPIENLTVAVVKVVNNGKMPIPASDYERPITFSAGPGTECVNAQVVAAHPAALTPSVWIIQKQQQSAVELVPLLLNAGDSVTVSFLVLGARGDLEVDARIAGVRAIAQIPPGHEQASARFLVVAFVLGLALAIAYLGITHLARIPSPETGVSTGLLAWALSVALIAAIAAIGLQVIRELK